jgi:hypothetical protein
MAAELEAERDKNKTVMRRIHTVLNPAAQQQRVMPSGLGGF